MRSRRHLIHTLAYLLLLPLAVLTAQFAGATLPLIPAAIIGGLVCGTTGALAIFSLSKALGI